MSADNYIGVIKTKDGEYGVIPYGCMSLLDEDCQYRGEITQRFISREKALVCAHDIYKQEYIVEYGVIELGAVPEKKCGRCWVCVNERGIVSDELERCAGCEKPIADTDWCVMTIKGKFHTRCESK